MTDPLDPSTRDRLLADPGAILSDRDLMRALISAHEGGAGDNVIDIRGRAMAALEGRLDRLEATHDSVIAAAYDTVSGMAIVHRAVLALMECADLTDLTACLQPDIAPMLRIETLRLIVEEGAALTGDVIEVPQGMIARIAAEGRRAPRGADIILRAAPALTRPLHGRGVASEALLPIDLGTGQPPAMLLMGSTDAARFTPAQGTDLLRFLAQAFRLVLLDRIHAPRGA